LEKYKYDERIFHIAGNNPLTYTQSEYSYYFARIPHVWGWASWRRAWGKYSFDIEGLDLFQINRIFKRKYDQQYFLDIFKRMEMHEVDTWDHQWCYTVLKNNGFAIIPTKNLIANIGFNEDATHTISPKSIYNNQKVYTIETIIHPKEVVIDEWIINKINKVAYNQSWLSLFKIKIKKAIKKILFKK
jgi:hypothetical protein